jgi:hypothetical protein
MQWLFIHWNIFDGAMSAVLPAFILWNILLAGGAALFPLSLVLICLSH